MSAVLGVLTVQALYTLYEDLKIIYNLKDGDSNEEKISQISLPILQRLSRLPKFDKLPMTPSKESEVEFDILIESLRQGEAESGEAGPNEAGPNEAGPGVRDKSPTESNPTKDGFNIQKLLFYKHF